jgi:hypothetical protein
MILLLAAIWVLVSGTSAAGDRRAEALDKIEPLILEKLATSDQTDFFIWMAERADLSAAYRLRTKEQRGRFVYEMLLETAEHSQRGLRQYLDSLGVEYRPFYIANKILVRGGNQALVQRIAVRADVSHITANHEVQLDEPSIEPPALEQILSVESNISFVGADSVWDMGVTGQGTVLANNDTGLQWDHPALIDQYRGSDGATVDHNYNWWDATGTYPTAAGDDHGHGTHTTGTMVGDDGDANQIGMAPGAKTIHCKNMTGDGTGTDATFTECFEWNLAPWDLNGENANPDLAPDAINNSWGYQGGNVTLFKDEIAALHAAGILVEVSAGNEGPWCGSVRSPGDYAEVLTTGSVNHGGAYPGTTALLSSRGPSDLDAGYFPDVMAPGENIRSSVPDDQYTLKSGTSMAGPHAVGLVGLIWSACPKLRGKIRTTHPEHRCAFERLYLVQLRRRLHRRPKQRMGPWHHQRPGCRSGMHAVERRRHRPGHRHSRSDVCLHRNRQRHPSLSAHYLHLVDRNTPSRDPHSRFERHDVHHLEHCWHPSHHRYCHQHWTYGHGYPYNHDVQLS